MAVSFPSGNLIHPLLKERRRLSTSLPPPGLGRDPRQAASVNAVLLAHWRDRTRVRCGLRFRPAANARGHALFGGGTLLPDALWRGLDGASSLERLDLLGEFRNPRLRLDSRL